MIKGYLDMRNMVGRGTKTISATPRQLESLIRLSEGLAKMRHARWALPCTATRERSRDKTRVPRSEPRVCSRSVGCLRGAQRCPPRERSNMGAQRCPPRERSNTSSVPGICLFQFFIGRTHLDFSPHRTPVNWEICQLFLYSLQQSPGQYTACSPKYFFGPSVGSLARSVGGMITNAAFGHVKHVPAVPVMSVVSGITQRKV